MLLTSYHLGPGSNDKTNIKNSKKDSTNKENQNPNMAEYQVSNVELLPGFICELIPSGRKHYFDSKGNKFNTFRKAQEAFVAGEKSKGKLPPGFHTKTQKSGKKYYLNENNLRFTNVASCWDDFNKKCASATAISAKGKLPPGFKAITRPSGKKYYINEANMKFFNIPSCWEAYNNIASVDKSQDSAPNRNELFFVS